MKKQLLLISLIVCCGFVAEAQFTRYIVRFSNKGSNPYSLSNPSQYLESAGARPKGSLEYRERQHRSARYSRYVDSVRLAGTVTILNVSKWLNQVSIQTDDPVAVAKINSLPFVISTDPIAARTAIVPVNKSLDYSAANTQAPVQTSRIVTDVIDYGQSYDQVRIHQGNFLHNHGFRGEGMQMAVMDAGFLNYNSIPTFDSMLMNNRLLGTWDFVANESSVAEDFFHGMQCLSTIAADMPGTFVGTAPKSSFYLYRTEDVNSEYPIEEHNFAVGTERADSAGVDICSTSLGYYLFDNPLFNYNYSMMDGNTTMSARASDIAAQKGLLMVTAAGNEGNGSWRFLITPSDADSALSVGAVNTAGQVAGFSSYGPSGDGQIKPSVAAVGWNAVVANTFSGLPAINSGTSFACPNMAGIASCLWQAFPEVNNMTIIDVLQRSASNFNTPDDRVGYGIPDAKKAFVLLQKMQYNKQINFVACKSELRFNLKTNNSMTIDVERKMEGASDYTLATTLQNNQAYGDHAFEFIDDLAGTTVSFVQYRLKVTIGTDTTYYLDSMTVNYAYPCDIPLVNEIRIGPNPVNDQLNVHISRTSTSKIELVIVNALGQKMYSTNYTQQAGITTKTIAMNSFSRGAYFITVFIDNKKEVTKELLKQ